ncbi:putative bifunctional diguanylate cyclase/phosphodiesterase [Shewanella dokdonensis]|uniref:putative bifunctional diguanylate cyclase/phosphodiesterase n=1 Tax=Shewanella dokdonensis TaxID=712036 RepID=UPI00200C4386|nr:EAL domain-containing protein [Shewanella dokdonensis]MCL1073169.1 EAL domain-containing protein [Shewanella dokdonensis]
MGVNRGKYWRLLELLTNSTAKQQGDFAGTAALATQLLCEHLQIDCASVWSWSKAQHIQFETARFGAAVQQNPRPSNLLLLPHYISELHNHLHIAAADAIADLRLAELHSHYIHPNHIKSSLDVAIRINGHIEGVLSLERHISASPWSDTEVHLACQVADQLALALATSAAYHKDEMLALFQSAIEKSAQITLLVNMHTELIEYVNKAHEVITGIPREKLLGRNIKELAFFRQAPEAAQNVLDRLCRGEVVRNEIPLQRKNGEQFWLKFYASQFETRLGNHYILITAEDHTDARYHQAELEHMAWHCNLTGLYNRTYFNRMLERTTDGYLLLVNLVGFKRYNDTYGHSKGDDLLVEIARRLRHFSALYSGAETARVGSDEFALLLPELKDELQYCYSRLYQQLSMPISLGRESVDVRPAIAIVAIDEVAETVAPLTCADIALQYAKKKQGTAIQIFNSTLLKAFKDDAEIERDLNVAIRGRQFELYYQPLKDLQRQTYIGAEALIRWHHPKRGIMYPGAFIDIAEQTGLINSIGSWVLEAACKQLYLWQHRNIEMSMHVNVSARQFFGGNLYEQVWDLLTRYRLKPKSLILEITETELMEDIRYATNLCQELADLGVGLAIDDFGTGYSSMRYLKQFPISKLKIDRSFISDLNISRQSQEIVSAIIAMATALNISLTAEGVETQEQERFLAENLCHQAQGFLYSPALREADFARFIEADSPLMLH